MLTSHRAWWSQVVGQSLLFHRMSPCQSHTCLTMLCRAVCHLQGFWESQQLCSPECRSTYAHLRLCSCVQQHLDSVQKSDLLATCSWWVMCRFRSLFQQQGRRHADDKVLSSGSGPAQYQVRLACPAKAACSRLLYSSPCWQVQVAASVSAQGWLPLMLRSQLPALNLQMQGSMA